MDAVWAWLYILLLFAPLLGSVLLSIALGAIISRHRYEVCHDRRSLRV